MAYTEPLFYNINAPVGIGPGANMHKSDVMLVQFFLIPWVREIGLVGMPGDELKCDGKVNDFLVGAIQEFQERHGNVPDGRVDPADHGFRSSVGQRSAQTKTIVSLNAFYKTRFPGRYQNLANDSGVPAELRVALHV